MIDLSQFPIDSSYLSKGFIKEYTLLLGDMVGLIWVLIFLPIYYFLQKQSIKTFKKMYPDEKVLHVVSTGILSTIVLTYIFGASFGSDILRFAIFENLTVFDLATPRTFWFYLLAHMITIWFHLLRCSMIIILSDKRLRLFIYFHRISPCKEQQQKINILYEDIASIEFYYFYFAYQCLCIKFKNNREPYYIPCYTGLKKAKEIISRYISKPEVICSTLRE